MNSQKPNVTHASLVSAVLASAVFSQSACAEEPDSPRASHRTHSHDDAKHVHSLHE